MNRGLKLPMNPPGKKIDRTAIGIVAGIADELIVEAQFRRRRQRIAVIGFDDLLQAGMRQLSVANEDAQASSIEKRLMDAGNPVEDASNPNSIVGPAPLLARNRNAKLECAVDIGEVPMLDT